jgi:hypothetical protein
MILMRSKGYSALLGIAFEGSRMTVVRLRKTGHRVQVRETLQTTLSLDPMTNDPELVGREIRNRLSDAGIRESRCVVCVPLKWALTLRAELPELSEADINSYVAVQAEREFPFAPEHLSLSVSRYCRPGGTAEATVVAIPINRLAALQKVFRAAKLRPVSLTFGVTSISQDGVSPQEGAVTLLIGQDSLDLAVSFAGGVTALRSLDEAVIGDQAGSDIDADSVAREIRITLGQLPQDLRDAIHTVRVFGPRDLADGLCAELQSLPDRAGMSVKTGEASSEVEALEPDAFSKLFPSAFWGAAGRLLNQPSGLEFLPPRSNLFKQITGRVSSRATLWLGGAAVAMVLLVSSFFLYQYWRLSRLESEWKSIEPRASELAMLQDKVRQFRPWFDDSIQGLTIVRKVTEAFPEDGTVWASNLEIKTTSDLGRIAVSCSGKARSNPEWLKVMERLRQTKGVEDLRFQQVRGDAPLQFTLSFNWNTRESNGS